MNNILSPILMAADLRQLNDLDEDTNRRLAIIRNSADRGADLFKQVLTFARGMKSETDIATPFMDGIAEIRALRKINPELKVIAASGLTTNEQSADLQSLNVNAFLSKPHTAEKLLTTLADILQSN